MERIRKWYERQDEYEKSAIIAFGIGCPIVLFVFVIILSLLKFFTDL